jgi:hypothetical protein
MPISKIKIQIKYGVQRGDIIDTLKFVKHLARR